MQCTWLCPKPGGTAVASVGIRRPYAAIAADQPAIAASIAATSILRIVIIVRAVDRLDQHFRGDLPGHAPAVLAPAAVAFLAAVADDGVPVAVRFGLVGGGDLEREGLGLLEDRASVKADAGNAEDGELDGEDVAGLAGREVARGMEDPSNRAVGEDAGVEAGRVEGIAFEPQADRVARNHDCLLVEGVSRRLLAAATGVWLYVVWRGRNSTRHGRRDAAGHAGRSMRPFPGPGSGRWAHPCCLPWGHGTV